MDTLGKRIAYYRKLQGLSQEKVAEHIGISRQAVTKWENDNSRPNTDNLLQLSALFEIPLNELVSSYSEDHSPEEKATRIDENGLLRNRMRIIIPIFLFTCGMNLLGISFHTYNADGAINRAFWLFSMVSVFIPACFMGTNILLDKELDRVKTARVELLYVIFQAGILILGEVLIGNIISLALSALVYWGYVVKINRSKLNRPLYIDKSKKQAKRDSSSPDFH